jgi:signal transduction histidine kinase
LRLEADILKCFRAGILAVDLSGTVIFVNEIAAKILNASAVTVGDNLRPRVGDNAFYRFLMESLGLKYLPSRVEVDLPGRHGSLRSIGFTLAELKDGDRRSGICAFFKDLTQIEMAEENRDLNERLRLLGQMAAGLAHEIRNPIASIGVHCSLLRSRCQGDPKMLSSLSRMESEIGKVEYIIRECLNFVRPAELGVHPVAVAPLLERIASQAGKLHGEVRVLFHGEGIGDGMAEMDVGLMEQALSNIVANAAQACGGKGNVTITARITHAYWDLDPDAREPLLPGGTGEREDFLTISVRDDGPGIPEDIRDKIFVPFFTTRKEGTGIGLPIAQKIIYAHKGVIDVLSEKGKGTEFIIKIPMRQPHV